MLMCAPVTLRPIATPALPTLVLVLSLAAGLCALAAPVRAVVADVPVMAASELRPGQHAIVRTVFAGDSIETFEATILGVLSGGRTEGDMILARATSERVIQCGVAEGMSGSPVYVDGKLIGALSSGWSFSKEPIFGITPIAEMLRVLDAPESAHPEGTAGPIGVDPLPAGAPRYHGFAWSDDTLAVAAPASGAGPRPLRLPLAAGGLSRAALDQVRDLFAASGFTVTPGGRAPERPAAAARARADFRPGSPVAVDVMRGDVNLSAIGTVTYRDGDRVLIFGHPFFQSGEVRMPLSTAEIVGILPSLENSFKLGEPGTPVGTATQDRRTAVAGRLGPVPELLPIRVSVASDGRPTQQFHFESIEDRGLLPQLAATAVLNSIMESGGGGAQQSVRWTLDLWRAGRTLHLSDAVAGEAPLSDMVTAVVGPLRFLYNNPFERVHLDSVTVRAEIQPGRSQWVLRAASIGAPSVRPGGTVRIRSELEPWRGPRETQLLELVVPRDLPDGKYVLWLGGGGEADRFSALHLPGRFRPVSLADAWARLGAVRASDALYAMLWARAPEVTSDGQDYPELPNSALAVLAPAQSAGDLARRADWALTAEDKRRYAGVVRGELLLEVNVDSKAP